MGRKSFVKRQGSGSIRLWAFALLVAGAMIVMCPLAYGQSGGTINGTVTDPTGARIPDVKVTLTNAATGTSSVVNTTSDGVYTASFLPVGTYSITCEHTGFKTEARTGIVLTSAQVVTVNVALAVGATQQTVTVEARPEQISTTSGTLGQTVSQESIKELPLNGRNPGELVYQVPGAISGYQTNGIAFPGQGSGPPTETAASVNGSRMGGVYYTLDGVNNMDSYFMTANPFPDTDATQEFRVLTNNFDAQYGFAPGAVVSVVTKSGTNQWHGNAFEFIRNNKLNAEDYFTHVADPLKRNQFGGSIGGPIRKNKLFIFGNYQQTIEHALLASSGAQVPNNKMLQGDFSDVCTVRGGHFVNGLCDDSSGNFISNGQLYYPTLTATPPYYNHSISNAIPNNFISPSMFNSIVANQIEAGLPKTDSPTGNIITQGQVKIDNTHEFTTKTDYDINDNQRLSFRFYLYNYNQPATTGGGNFLLSNRSNQDRNTNLAGTYTWTISPTLLNNLTIGYNRVNSATLPGLVDKSGKPVSFESLGTKIPDLEKPPTIGLIATDGFWITEVPVVQQRHSYIIDDTVSWSKGKHMVVAGVNVLTNYSLEQATWLADPLVFFNDSLTGSWYSDFLLGNLSGLSQGGGEYNPVAGINWAGFVQDSIHLKPNLTVNLGVRWEPEYPPHSLDHGRLGVFWPGHQSTKFPNAPAGLVYPGDPGVPDGGWFGSSWKLNPRLSVAWAPSAVPNTTVRAAFGIFNIPYDMSFYNHNGSNAPFSPDFNLNWNDPTNILPCSLQFNDPWSCYRPTGGMAPFPPFSVGAGSYVPTSSATFVLPVSIPATFDPHFTTGTDESWNFSIEHRFPSNITVTTAYIGRRDYHLPLPLDLNPGFFSAGGARLLYPNFGQILSSESEGTGTYNALQLSFKRSFSHGLMFTSNYTWSKQIDNSSVGTLSNVGSVGDPFNINWNRGLGDLNIPQIWSNYWVWQMPALTHYGPVVSKIFGNWEIAGIWDMHSGLPFSIQGGNGNDSSLSQEGADRADVTGQPFGVHQGAKSHWLNQYFNPAAFQPNAPGTFGDSGRNALQGPGFNSADLMVARNFPFKERYNLEFRWEMFNAFNRTWFGLPDTYPNDLTFGQINGTASVSPLQGANRLMQGGIKLTW